MKPPQPEDERALAKLLARQQALAFDIEEGLPWKAGVDLSRWLVPLDRDALIFPGASPAQRLALSQYLGLIIAQTFGEMETALVQAKELVWKRTLDRWPINPEFTALGEQFFIEEEKHSRMFRRYLKAFAEATGVTHEELVTILPTVSGTLLHRSLKLNSEFGGHALWWVLTLVEEVSILIYKQMIPFAKSLDPLYFAVHKRHYQEEVRHSPYSYWMLEHLYRRDKTWAGAFFRRTDAALSQGLEVAWALSSLTRVKGVLWLRKRHPFYAELLSCLPLLRRLSPVESIRRLFVTAPFVSLLLNPNNFPDFTTLMRRLRAVPIPTPRPKAGALGVEA